MFCFVNFSSNCFIFQRTYRHRQRTREGIRLGDPEQIISPQGLNSQGLFRISSFPFNRIISSISRIELEKAIAIFEQRNLHNQIQAENYERYLRLRNKRREQEGLS